MSEERVLFWSPYASWGYHAAQEATLAWALAQRGHPVLIMGCNSLFRSCDVFRETTVRREEGSCDWCMRTSRQNLAPVAAVHRWLGEYLPAEGKAAVDAWARALPTGGLLSARWRGRPVGEWATSSALYQFRAEALDLEDPHQAEIVRELVHGTALALEGLLVIFEHYDPEILLTLNGRFFSHRVAMELARERGCRFVTHERGFLRGSLRLHPQRPIHALSNYDDPWERWKDVPLSPAELEWVDRLLHDRRHGRNMNWAPFSPPPRDDQDLRRALALDDRPVVAVFTSSREETSTYPEYRQGAFPDGSDWLPAVVEMATRFPDHLFVIRIHPNVGSVHGMGIAPELQELEALRERLPENCRMVMPADEISSYRLADLSAAILVYYSTLGLELAAEGKAVVSVARGWYGGAGVVPMATSPEDMEAKLRTALSARPDLDQVRRAWRLIHTVFTEFSIPFAWVEEPEAHSGRVTWTDPSVLGPGQDDTLDRICALISEGEAWRPPPGQEERHRTTEHEDAWLRRRVHREG